MGLDKRLIGGISVVWQHRKTTRVLIRVEYKCLVPERLVKIHKRYLFVPQERSGTYTPFGIASQPPLQVVLTHLNGGKIEIGVTAQQTGNGFPVSDVYHRQYRTSVYALSGIGAVRFTESKTKIGFQCKDIRCGKLGGANQIGNRGIGGIDRIR